MTAPRACTSCLRAFGTRHRQSMLLDSLARRVLLYQQPPLQASPKSSFSTTTSRHGSQSLVKQPRTPSRSSGKTAVFLATAAILGGAWYGLSSTSEDDSLNGTKFTPFNIVSREQVSPTAFIITIRCPEEVASRNADKIQRAWDHGMWSVEMKQPQLQIARHYTPLPPLSDAEAERGELRFLIRKMESGEMSNYLSRLRVGNQVWLRGPHYGFDIVKRMGDAKDVVFLAGGTGIAPALQIAHKLLGASTTADQSSKPSIRILWANRRNVDSLGRHAVHDKSKTVRIAARSDTLTSQIMELKGKHGDSFNVDYFVDNERFIAVKDINAAVGSQTYSKAPKFAATDKRCRWHSHEGLAATSYEDDKSASDIPCICRPHNMPPEPIGRNILGVSGPDGFIEAYVGPKRWFGGREIQGPVLGLLGSMKRMDPSMDDWLILKL